VWKRFKAQEGAEPSIRVRRTVRSTRDIAYRGIASRSSKLLQRELRYRDPRYPDKLRTVHRVGHVSGDPEESGFGESGFSKNKKLLPLGIAKRDIPTEGLCGPQSGLVEDRWHTISGIGKR
jgi:hypothetical protein